MHKTESLLAFLAIAALSAICLRPSIRGHDGAGNYVPLRSVLLDRDLDFTNDYRDFDLEFESPAFRLSDARISPVTGLPANRYGIGAAIFWAPAVAPVHWALEAAAPEAATGLSRPYQWAVGAASAWWAALGLWLLFERLRRGFGRIPAWCALAGIHFATPLVFYAWLHGSMSHAVSFFLATLSMLSLERAIEGVPGTIRFAAARRLASAFVAGACSGLLVLARMQDVTWAVVAGVALPLCAAIPKEGGRRAARAAGARAGLAAAFGLGAALAFSPQMFVWKVLYGSPFSGPLPYFGQGGGDLSPVPRHLFAVLFSERGGVLAWHPILAVGLAGLVFGALAGGPARSNRETAGNAGPGMAEEAVPGLSTPMAWIGLAGFLVQLLLVSSWSMWWGGASFGNRFFISSFPFLALGLGESFARAERNGRAGRASIPILVCVLGLWNAGLLVQYGTEMIPREGEVPWSEVIGNQFTRVPEWTLGRLGR